MPRVKNAGGNLEAIAAQRARLQAELAKLDEAEKAANEVMRDAGRETLMTALGRVKIAAMTKVDAKAIANAIGALGAAEAARKLTV